MLLAVDIGNSNIKIGVFEKSYNKAEQTAESNNCLYPQVEKLTESWVFKPCEHISEVQRTVNKCPYNGNYNAISRNSASFKLNSFVVEHS